MAMFRVKEFAAYISQNYYNMFSKTISPVRLQKTLYFCFAYWGGFIRKGKLQEENKIEIDVNVYDEYLFDTQFEAWVYGPVVPEVYFEKNIENFYRENLFENKEFVEQFVKEVIEDINEVSDFKLVDLSHQDNSWKNNFNYDDQYHNNIIANEEIIEEYARK